MKITFKKGIILGMLVIILFCILIMTLNIRDAIKNHLPITNDYIHVLEKVELIDHNGNSYSAPLSTNKLAELRDFREYKIHIGNEILNIQFINVGFTLYINNSGKNLFNLVDTEKIMLLHNKQSEEVIFKVTENKGLLLSAKNIIDTYQEETGDITVKLPLKDGGLIELFFPHALNKEIFFAKGYRTYLQSSLTEKLIYWWYGIDFDQKKIKNLSF